MKNLILSTIILVIIHIILLCLFHYVGKKRKISSYSKISSSNQIKTIKVITFNVGGQTIRIQPNQLNNAYTLNTNPTEPIEKTDMIIVGLQEAWEVKSNWSILFQETHNLFYSNSWLSVGKEIIRGLYLFVWIRHGCISPILKGKFQNNCFPDSNVDKNIDGLQRLVYQIPEALRNVKDIQQFTKGYIGITIENPPMTIINAHLPFSNHKNADLRTKCFSHMFQTYQHQKGLVIMGDLNFRQGETFPNHGQLQGYLDIDENIPKTCKWTLDQGTVTNQTLEQAYVENRQPSNCDQILLSEHFSEPTISFLRDGKSMQSTDHLLVMSSFILPSNRNN